MTVKIRYIFVDRGDHLAYRSASEYVYDPRDLDASGQPPPHFLRAPEIVLEEGEREFDHLPTEVELQAAFPEFFARQKAKDP
jgi:hypothetical protein